MCQGVSNIFQNLEQTKEGIDRGSVPLDGSRVREERQYSMTQVDS